MQPEQSRRHHSHVSMEGKYVSLNQFNFFFGIHFTTESTAPEPSAQDSFGAVKTFISYV